MANPAAAWTGSTPISEKLAEARSRWYRVLSTPIFATNVRKEAHDEVYTSHSISHRSIRQIENLKKYERNFKKFALRLTDFHYFAAKSVKYWRFFIDISSFQQNFARRRREKEPTTVYCQEFRDNFTGRQHFHTGEITIMDGVWGT